jgi:3-dehydroquinate synthase
MNKLTYNINSAETSFLFNLQYTAWLKDASMKNCYLITDTNLYSLHKSALQSFPHYVIRAGELYKTSETVQLILQDMLDQKIDRSAMIIGMGGGVVTDITGFVAAIYKRGTSLSLIPTSLLGMIDAAIGGKNGVNAGLYKNVIGTIHQPNNIIFDFDLPDTLSEKEWRSGMAEIIKHAVTLAPKMINLLQENNIDSFRSNKNLLADLVEQNVRIKMDVVCKDSHDLALRHVLNFGHTLGHAIEQLHDLAHGEAVSIGMVFACRLSETYIGFSAEQTATLIQLLEQYQLPVSITANAEEVVAVMMNDKKNNGNDINYILLEDFGKPVLHSFSADTILEKLTTFFQS